MKEKQLKLEAPLTLGGAGKGHVQGEEVTRLSDTHRSIDSRWLGRVAITDGHVCTVITNLTRLGQGHY